MNYKYFARFIKAVDGDTIDVILDLGFKVNFTTRLRLVRIDTHEMHDPVPESRALAMKAREAVTSLLSQTTYLDIETFKHPTDKYGRYLAEVRFIEGNLIDGKLINLSDRLMELGLAKSYIPGAVKPPGETI